MTNGKKFPTEQGPRPAIIGDTPEDIEQSELGIPRSQPLDYTDESTEMDIPLDHPESEKGENIAAFTIGLVTGVCATVIAFSIFIK